MHKSNVKHKIGCNNPAFAQNWIDSAPDGKIHLTEICNFKKGKYIYNERGNRHCHICISPGKGFLTNKKNNVTHDHQIWVQSDCKTFTTQTFTTPDVHHLRRQQVCNLIIMQLYIIHTLLYALHIIRDLCLPGVSPFLSLSSWWYPSFEGILLIFIIHIIIKKILNY